MTQYRIKKLGPKLYEVQKKVLLYWGDAFSTMTGVANMRRLENRQFDSYHAARSYLKNYLEKGMNVKKNVPAYFYPPFPDNEP